MKEETLTIGSDQEDLRLNVRRLKAVNTREILFNGGRTKEYVLSETTFTKKRMFLGRYEAEVKGLTVMDSARISVPKIACSWIDNQGGNVTLERIDDPRLDQALWNNPNLENLDNVGKLLAQIHSVHTGFEVTTDLARMRFFYFVKEIKQRASIPESIHEVALKAMDKACLDLNQSSSGYIHGDFNMQNIFCGKSGLLTVFDWEHSQQGPGLYDVGVFASFLYVLVTDGGWSFPVYQRAVETFLNGYSSVIPLSEKSLDIIKTLIFLGHRIPAQYYRFVLEFLAVTQDRADVLKVLKGNTSGSVSEEILASAGITINDSWKGKLLGALQQKDYQIDYGYWNRNQ